MKIAQVKTCSWCQEEKLLEDFWKDKDRKLGRDSYCKECRSDREKIRYSKNRLEILKKNKEYRKKNTVELRKKSARKSLMERYGITVEIYDQMLKEQSGVCAICGNPPYGKRKRLDVDHCHETGKVRGLLCNPCNIALGGFRDNVTLLRTAINYLEDVV